MGWSYWDYQLFGNPVPVLFVFQCPHLPKLLGNRTISRHKRYSDTSCMLQNRSVDERYHDSIIPLHEMIISDFVKT